MASVRPYPRSKRQPCWELDYYDPITKKRVREYFYGVNRKLAESIRKRKEAEITMIRYGIIDHPNQMSDLLLSEAIAKFNKQKKIQGLKERTLSSYSVSLSQLLLVLGDIPISKIKKSHKSLLLEYFTLRLNTSSVNHRMRCIRVLFHFLVENEYLPKLPFKISKLKQDKQLPKFLTPDQIELIFEQVKEPDLLAFYRVLEHTGMRRSEVKLAVIDGEYIRVTGKNRKERLIKVPDLVKKDLLLAKKTGYSLDWANAKFKQYANNVGFDATLHYLRHTFALRKLVETGDVYKVKLLLGHSSVVITEIYLQFPMEYLRKVFGKNIKNRQ